MGVNETNFRANDCPSRVPPDADGLIGVLSGKARPTSVPIRCAWAGVLLVAVVVAGDSRAIAQSNDVPDAETPAPTTARSDTDDPRNDEFVRRLLRRAAGEGDDEEVLQRIMRLMEASRMRLAGEFDPGERTQQIQSRILEELDEMTRRAGQRHQQQPQQRQQRSAERRSRGQRQNRPQQDAAQTDAEQPGEAGDDQATTADADADSEPQRPVERIGRSWGHLPPRDRDAVIQGIKDEYLPRFRDLIERYYKALSRSEDER